MRNLLKSLAGVCGLELLRRRRVRAPYVRDIHAPGVDYRFWIANDVGQLWYGGGDHARNAELLALRDLAGTGARVLEIGCHHGFHTVFLGRLVGTGGTVVGVEAEPGNALIAQAQLTLNRLAHCRIEPAAAGAATGRATISLVDNVIGGAGLADEQIDVPVVTADALDASDGPFTVLKIDVEGFEAQVLHGAAGILARRPRLALELHPRLILQAGDRLEDVSTALGRVGYRGTILLPTNAVIDYVPDRLTSLARQHEKLNLFLVPT